MMESGIIIHLQDIRPKRAIITPTVIGPGCNMHEQGRTFCTFVN